MGNRGFGFAVEQRVKVIGCLLMAVLVSCASAERGRPGTSPNPELPVTSSPGQNPSIPPGGPILVSPRRGLVDPRPHPFQRARVAGRRSVVVRFYGGVEACEGLDHVDVEYEPNRIVITLFVGRVPTAEACIEVAVLKVTRVHLKEPVAGREIVDGADRR